jgi:hypothetical protein
MPAHSGAREPGRVTSVEIRVRGRVPVATADRLGLTASVAPERTVLRGTVPDRPALHGALERLRVGGFELIEVRRLPVPGRRP